MVYLIIDGKDLNETPTEDSKHALPDDLLKSTCTFIILLKRPLRFIITKKRSSPNKKALLNFFIFIKTKLFSKRTF